MRTDHGRSRALRGAAVALAVACAIGAFAVPAGSTEPRPVFVLGDSVTVGATPAIEAGASAQGWSVTIDAEVGRSTAQGAAILASMHGAFPSVVVVELGNNDGASPGAFATQVDAVMHQLAGVDHVVWFTMSPFASWVPAANAVLQTALDRWPNLELADWSTVATATMGALYGSGPHLQPVGGQAYADLLYREINRVAPAPPVVSLRAAPRSQPSPRRPVSTLAPPRGVMLGVNAPGWAAPRSIVAPDGGLFAFAGARFYGSMGGAPGGSRLVRPIAALRETASGHGYWLVDADGALFAFGDARFCPATGGLRAPAAAAPRGIT